MYVGKLMIFTEMCNIDACAAVKNMTVGDRHGVVRHHTAVNTSQTAARKMTDQAPRNQRAARTALLPILRGSRAAEDDAVTANPSSIAGSSTMRVAVPRPIRVVCSGIVTPLT